MEFIPGSDAFLDKKDFTWTLVQFDEENLIF